MTSKARIAKAERTHKAQSNNGIGRIAVYYAHETVVKVDGVQMSRAEWDKIKTDNDREIVIRFVDEAIKDGDK